MRKSHISRVATAITLAATWSLPAVAQQPGSNTLPQSPDGSGAVPLEEPVIDMTTERTSYPNTPLLVTGAVVLGATYGASAIAAGAYDYDWDEQLYYPVAGPWLALDERDCNAEPCENKDLGTALLIGSGVLQGVGALSMLMSLVIPQRETQDWYLIGNEDVVVTPVAGTREIGAFAVGRF